VTVNRGTSGHPICVSLQERLWEAHVIALIPSTLLANEQEIIKFGLESQIYSSICGLTL